MEVRSKELGQALETPHAEVHGDGHGGLSDRIHMYLAS